ncbi:MAG: FKBP-type peptidyl-prolyl cis-trans isomerase [Treponema sp.]|jgi:FKBP-type peptidyl-prolyl cis-trans isomerase|nr:FKBP-type peptidyl-prolyl cis-trans isomerase [Treponema sp.]
MKYKHWLILAILIAATIFWGCKNSNSGSSAGKENFDKDASYALGMSVGAGFKDNLETDGIVMNIDEFMKGLKDSLTGEKTRFDEYQAVELINTAFDALAENKNAEATQKENAFLAENSKKPGVIITPSGLQYEIISETNGRKPSITDTVQVHYEGRLTDGTIFDSSIERGLPIEFPLNAVISGWSEGLQLMSVGSKYIFYIPSEQGYGPSGWGPIPGYATLIFDVELLGIINAGE